MHNYIITAFARTIPPHHLAQLTTRKNPTALPRPMPANLHTPKIITLIHLLALVLLEIATITIYERNPRARGRIIEVRIRIIRVQTTHKTSRIAGLLI
jgi:hypothetical protein